MAMLGVLWPILAWSSARVAPSCAAKVALVWRRPWTVSPGMSMAALPLSWAARSTLSFRGSDRPLRGTATHIPAAGGLLGSPGPPGWQQVGRDRHRPDAGVRLGWADQELPLEPDDGLADVDHACVEVEVADPQPADFVGTQPTPAGQEQRHPPSLWHSSQV